jgi:hypothetical protein
MTDYTADTVNSQGTATANLRTGTASADTVPAGAVVLFQNTGAGTHNIDLGVNYAWDGLAPGSAATGPGKRRFTLAAGAWLPVRVRADAGDANGRCSVTIDGTATEVKYFVLGV